MIVKYDWGQGHAWIIYCMKDIIGYIEKKSVATLFKTYDHSEKLVKM